MSEQTPKRVAVIDSHPLFADVVAHFIGRLGVAAEVNPLATLPDFDMIVTDIRANDRDESDETGLKLAESSSQWGVPILILTAMIVNEELETQLRTKYHLAENVVFMSKVSANLNQIATQVETLLASSAA